MTQVNPAPDGPVPAPPLVAISGSAGGLGSALRALLQSRGARVVGIDLAHAEVCADLASADGRRQAVEAVLEWGQGRLDALVCAAGLGGTTRPAGRIVAVNHFGALALLDGLLPALRRSPAAAAVAVASVAVSAGPWAGHRIEAACLADDEALACRLADQARPAYAAYGCSKRALALQVRRRARDWAAAGVRLNAVAPGPIDTPLHHAALADPLLGPLARDFLPPLGRIARAEEIAAMIAFLLSPQAAYLHGAVLFADGGCDALLRPEVP